jgi:hypothetical protein
VLQIDIENLIEDQTDTMDTSRYGTNPDITPSAGMLRFAPAIAIGDIVAVNGEPAKGTFVGRPWDLTSRTELTPGRPIADISRVSVGFRTFELLKPDGRAIGTLMVLGLDGGVSPPGGNLGGQNFAIVGGTGAFLGAGGKAADRYLSSRFRRARRGLPKIRRIDVSMAPFGSSRINASRLPSAWS